MAPRATGLVAPTTFESCLQDSWVKMKGQSAKVAAKYGVSAMMWLRIPLSSR
jgi:hypothetical protein